MNILEHIKDTEQKAIEIKRAALIKSRDILRDREREAREAAAKDIQSAETLAADALEKAATAAEEKARRLLVDSAAKDDEFIHKAQAMLPSAIAYIAGLAEDIK